MFVMTPFAFCGLVDASAHVDSQTTAVEGGHREHMYSS